MFQDRRPFTDIIFDVVMMLCDRFPGCTPFTVRKEKAREVFEVVVLYTRHAKHDKKTRTKDGKKIIRKPAPDTWW